MVTEETLIFFQDFIEESENIFQARDELRKKYEFAEYDNFNIFELPELNWDETVHSKVLSKILDPKTPVIGSESNLKSFFRLIGLTKEAIAEWDFNTVGVDIEVTENKLSEWFEANNKSANTEGRIDILISDNKKNCVIIENKLKNAPNMPNQLERYVRIAEHHDLKIHKIVYMPITNEKQPDSCTSEYKAENEKIRNKWLITIPAVKNSNDTTVKSLVQDFFPMLLLENLSESNMVKMVCFDQYQKLIAKLGEDGIMEETEKKLVKMLCENPDAQKNANDLIELIRDYKKFNNLKYKLLCEQCNLISAPKDLKYYYGSLLKTAYTETDIYFYVGCQDGGNFGIAIKDSADKTIITELESRIKDNVSNGNKYDFYDYGEFRWGSLYFSKIGKSLESDSISDLAKIIKKAFDEIQQALLK